MLRSSRLRSCRCWARTSRRNFQQLLLAINQRINVAGRQFKSMSVRDCICRAGFHAIPAENTARIVNVVHAGITLTRRNPRHVGVFCRLDINAVRRACRRAKKTAYALFQSALVAVQHVDAAVARLKMYFFVRIIFRNGFAEYIAKCDAETLRQRTECFSYFPEP